MISGDTTAISNTYTNIETVNCLANQWITINGYFAPDVTGYWSIRMVTDGISYLWIGDEAFSTFDKTNTLLKKDDNYKYGVRFGTFYVEAGEFYPLRYIYGKETKVGCLSFSLRFARPGSSQFLDNLSNLVTAPNDFSAIPSWSVPLALLYTLKNNSLVDDSFVKPGLRYYLYDELFGKSKASITLIKRYYIIEK